MLSIPVEGTFPKTKVSHKHMYVAKAAYVVYMGWVRSMKALKLKSPCVTAKPSATNDYRLADQRAAWCARFMQ